MSAAKPTSSPSSIAAKAIGTALKQTQIAWAASHGYRELITFTQQGNEAMRRVNEKLGYVEQPAWLTMRRNVP